MKILAIIAAHNEGDVIYHVLRDLIENGVQVYLIDDGSTDNTVVEAERWIGRGLLQIEKIAPAASSTYVWRELLVKKERIAQKINPDWCLHADADEFREAPWTGVKLAEAFEMVDAAGFNAIDFSLLNFRPTSNDFAAGTDVRDSIGYYEPGAECDSIQIKAWKHCANVPVDLVTSGGHQAVFPNRSVFPIRFILRHYPLRSVEQMRKKLGQDRLNRFDSMEKAAGWHIQYDDLASENAGLWNPQNLKSYDGQALRLELLEQYTRQPHAYSQYTTNLIQERHRLRELLLSERGEVARLFRESTELKDCLKVAEEKISQQKSSLEDLETATKFYLKITKERARILAKKKKRVLIWGAGSGGKKALKFLRQTGIRVDAFIDTDPAKIGKMIARHPVLAPESLKTRAWNRSSSAVFIASTARQKIESALARMGWLAGTDYFDIPQIVIDRFPARVFKSLKQAKG